MLPTVTLVKQLKPRFFEGLTPTEIASIIAPAARRSFPAQSVMSREGYAANSFFMVLRGRARGFCMTPQGDKVPVRWFPPGEIFGGAAMLPESVDYLICTEAVTNITVLAWDRTTIRSLRARYERLADNAAMIAYDYLVLYRSLHLAARCDTAPQRFALVLANLATGIGRQVDGGFELDVRNEELANEAGVTIFTASRLMSRWALEGIIAKGRGKIVVLSLAALYSLAGTL